MRKFKFTKTGFTENSRWQNRAPMIVAVALALSLACLGLSNHAFWDDEAGTALFARNLLKTGELTAWDGVNLNGYNHSLTA